MKYLVLWRESAVARDSRGNNQGIDFMKYEAFDSQTEATQFCKEKNGYIVKALDLVMEEDTEKTETDGSTARSMRGVVSEIMDANFRHPIY